MSESAIYPAKIELDIVLNGYARLLVHPSDPIGIIRDDQIFYQYDEVVLEYEIPLTYTNNGQNITISSRADVEDYLAANSTAIIEKAKAKKISV